MFVVHFYVLPQSTIPMDFAFSLLFFEVVENENLHESLKVASESM